MRIFLKLFFLILVLTQGYALTQSYGNRGSDIFYKGLEAHQNKDFQRAFRYFENACNLNEGQACFNVGFLYFEGKIVKQDYKEALKYYQKGCALGSSVGCREFERVQKQLSHSSNKK